MEKRNKSILPYQLIQVNSEAIKSAEYYYTDYKLRIVFKNNSCYEYDDVPARLSVNEFVFTADAVRNAGGGDIDKGAEVMENMMKNLENGGTVSEESQGNTGAQNMFSVSERIGEVI